MKLGKRKDKNNNSIKVLLKKLKRHDTAVVAVAVVIALILCGGLIYISTPVMAEAAKEEFVESERNDKKMTADKLQEISDNLTEVVKANNEELSTREATAELKKQLEDMLTQLNSMNGVIEINKETVKSIRTNTSGNGENISRVENQAIELQKALSEYISKYETTTNNTNNDVKNSFETVYKDLENMLDTVGDNNDKQNDNYSNLSKQMSKTLEDINKLVNDLGDDNEKQYTSVTDQMNEFEDALNKYLENKDAEYNTTLDNLDDHLTSVQGDITNTKKEITALLTDVDKKQTEELKNRFDKVQGQLGNITAHFDGTASEIEELIGKLSDQNKTEHAETIAKLSEVQANLLTLNNTNTKQLVDELNKVQQDYNNLFDKLDKEIVETKELVSSKLDKSNEDIIAKITESNEKVSAKIDETGNSINEKVSVTGSSITTKIGEGNTAITSRIGEGNEAIKSKIGEGNEAIKSTIGEGNAIITSRIGESNNAIKSKIDDSNKDLANKINDSNNVLTSKIGEGNNTLASKIESSNTSTGTKIDALGGTLDETLKSINNNINNHFNNAGTNTASLERKIETLQQKIDQSFTSVSKGKNLLASTLLTYGISVDKDAKFQTLSDAIVLLGEKKKAGDEIILNAKNDAEPGKIMAGQSVTIADTTITGTATSDATAGEGDILSGKSAYVNGVRVEGGIPRYDMGNIVLSSSNKTQTFPAGYYDSFTVSTDVTEMAGSISYNIGHQHVGEANSRSANGCYTVPQTVQVLESGRQVPCGGTLFASGENVCCTVCPNVVRWQVGETEARWYEGIVHMIKADPEYVDVTIYTLGCGHEEGEFVRESTDVSTLAADEKILSATINY